MATVKRVYTFGNKLAEGKAGMKNLLGGKGANLAEMTRLDIEVPPGFTISTEACTYYYQEGKKLAPGLEDEMRENLSRLEEALGLKFGDPTGPLLVSVRSGAKVSMPGMMDTVLNIGLNDESVKGLAKRTNNERFAWELPHISRMRRMPLRR